MPKNTKGGNRHKKMASKNAKPSYSLKMRYKNEEEECEMYAKVLQIFGGGMVQVLCDDKQERLCVMRRKFKGRNKRDNQISMNSILLVGLREWEVVQKNKKELNQVHKIIQMFRFHMSPALIGQTQYFASPSQFMLTYMYRQDENNYIPKIAKCVLETIDVDYSPGEKFTTLKPDNMGASPQVITMNLTFKEMSIITKETIAEGY